MGFSKSKQLPEFDLILLDQWCSSYILYVILIVSFLIAPYTGNNEVVTIVKSTHCFKEKAKYKSVAIIVKQYRHGLFRFLTECLIINTRDA